MTPLPNNNYNNKKTSDKCKVIAFVECKEPV